MGRHAWPLLALSGIALASCTLASCILASCTVESECEDLDLDGYGPFCELGEDCDPNNPLRNTSCETQPAPDCAAEPGSTGCPCLVDARDTCLDEADGVGICRAGLKRCVNGFWGICDGGIAPQSERCDQRDEDCDGIVDEGVVSPCGGCTPGCVGGVWGEAPNAFEATDGLALTLRGELTLGTMERAFGALWIANTAEATLSRVDTDEARETARYPSGGPEPSRVAVDHRGDAWIVNRAFDGTASVTKVAGEAPRCVDRDGDGLRTSSGPSDVLGIDEDECVLFHVAVGGPGDVARSIAIDGDTGLDGISGGDAWVGLHDGQAIVELDGLTGAELRRVPTPGFSPYASTFDRWGTLWVISRDGLLARVDPRPAVPTVEIVEVPLPCYLLYGLAADEEGRLLMTGFSCDQVVVYDPAIQRWSFADAPLSPRAATHDPAVGFWIAHTAAMASHVTFDARPRVDETWSVGDDAVTPVETIGVAVDAAAQVWTVSSQGGPDGRGVATRLDPETGAIGAQVTVGLAPHVQGDLTGSRLRVAPVPSASTTEVFEGCVPAADTEWLNLHVAGTPGGQGSITLEARHAPDRAGLSAAAWVTLGTIPDDPAPYPLAFPAGGVLEVRLTLSVDGLAGAPRVRRVGVEWRCPGPD